MGKRLLVNLLPKTICREAKKWLGKKTNARKAWNKCERGDWLIWILAWQKVDKRQLVLVLCECARLSLKYVEKGEERPLKAIEIAEAWARGEASIGEVEKAVDVQCTHNNTCYSYAYRASNSVASIISLRGFTCIDYTSIVSSVVVCAAIAANRAGYSEKDVFLDCANVVRKYFPDPPLISNKP